MNLFREIILDSEPEPRSVNWPVVFDVVLAIVWFAVLVWVLRS